MKTQKFLACIVVVYMMIIAFAVAKYHNTNSTLPIPLPENVTVTPVKGMPVREVVHIDTKQFECLATNLYFEARNQHDDVAVVAVGFTVLNRVADKQYPNTICKVVYQGRKSADGNYIKHKCQFSWVCDGVSDVPPSKNSLEVAAWNRARMIAMEILKGEVKNPIGNATMYHATYVNPYWVKAYIKVATLEDHTFYRKA